MRYADLYNGLYEADHPDAWIVKAIRRRRRPAASFRLMRHVRTLTRTQLVVGRLAPDTLVRLDHFVRVVNASTYSLLCRLQRAICHYLWKPHGPMMRKSMREFVYEEAKALSRKI